MKSKQDKIALLSDLIAGKISPKEVIQAMPAPLCIAWSWSGDTDDDDNPETYIYVANGRRITKQEYDKALKIRLNMDRTQKIDRLIRVLQGTAPKAILKPGKLVLNRGNTDQRFMYNGAAVSLKEVFALFYTNDDFECEVNII
jgi:hypothetical protein